MALLNDGTEKRRLWEDVTCRNRFLGKCENCKKDYDTRHYPNNYHCSNHIPMHIWVYTGLLDSH